MTTATFSPFHMLTDAQKLRVWELWRDGVEPTDHVYQLQDGQVVGRAALLKKAKGKAAQFSEFDYGLPPAIPAPVSSALRDPKPITTRDVLHELPPAMRPRAVRNPRPRLLISKSENRTRQDSRPEVGRKHLSLAQIERNLEFPYPGANGRKRKRGLGAALIHWIAVAIYNNQKGLTA